MKNVIIDHPFAVQEIEELFPFERDLYIGLLEAYMKEKEEARRNATR